MKSSTKYQPVNLAVQCLGPKCQVLFVPRKHSSGGFERVHRSHVHPSSQQQVFGHPSPMQPMVFLGQPSSPGVRTSECTKKPIVTTTYKLKVWYDINSLSAKNIHPFRLIYQTYRIVQLPCFLRSILVSLRHKTSSNQMNNRWDILCCSGALSKILPHLQRRNNVKSDVDFN